MFQTDLLSVIKCLNTVYTAIGICHASYVDCLLARSGWFRHIRVKSMISDTKKWIYNFVADEIKKT